jgi:hypothetical protein
MGKEKPMSLLGTLLVLLIVSVVILLLIMGVLFDRVDQHKQDDLRRKREAAQRRSATVVSIEHKIDWADSIMSKVYFKYNLDNYYLMVEWTNPETQLCVTSPTRVMPAPCRYHPGDEVFIYVHPAMKEVWVDIPHQRPRTHGQ